MSAVPKARIEEIRLQNYRALANVRLGLADMTFLVGRNGAGKSSLLDAIELMREAVTDSLPNALDRRGSFEAVHRRRADAVDPVGIAMVLRVTVGDREGRVLYGFSVSKPKEQPALHIEEVLRAAPGLGPGFRRSGEAFESEVPLSPRVAPGRLVLPLIAGEPLWLLMLDTLAQMRTYEIVPRDVALDAPIRATTNLEKSGANAGDVLAEVRSRPDALAALTSTLAVVAPGVTAVNDYLYRGRRAVLITQTAGERESSFLAWEMSQGTLRTLGLLLALHQSPEPSLVLIDEVEDSIHPRALEAVLEAVEGCTDRFPVVLTTHSPEVLSKRQVTPERVRIVQWNAGTSGVYPLSQGTRESVDALTTVGDLLRFNGLWPDEAPETFAGDLFELDG